LFYFSIAEISTNYATAGKYPTTETELIKKYKLNAINLHQKI